MSAGPFTKTRYELDGGSNFAPISVQPETLTFTSDSVANEAPTESVNLGISVYTRKPKRRYGIGARTVTISWNGNPPTDYKDENLTVPVLRQSVFDGYSVGDAATYLSTACVIVSKTPQVLT